MGCDIHMQVQRRVGEAWETVSALPRRPCSWCKGRGHYEGRPKDQCYSCKGDGGETGPYDDRNYTVFSVLANVRNDGYVKPIAEPRGLPEGLAEELPEDPNDEDKDLMPLGDHSFSWMTLRELAEHDWKQPREDEGFVDADKFKAWEAAGGGKPTEWCRSVSGNSIVHVSNSEMRRRISHPYGWENSDRPYTLVRWTLPISDDCKSFLAFVETLHALGSPDDVRIVFGFDS